MLQAVRTTLVPGAAQDAVLTALHQLFNSPLECLGKVTTALHTLHTLTTGCGIEHPAFPIYQKHAALHT